MLPCRSVGAESSKPKMTTVRGLYLPMTSEERTSTYTVSLSYDRRLYRQDLAGSIAHARMLGKQGIISEEEAELIVTGLTSIRQDIEDGSFVWREDLEDLHMNVEAALFQKIGDVAGKLHTARSRNDQVATDVRLYCKEAAQETLGCIKGAPGGAHRPCRGKRGGYHPRLHTPSARAARPPLPPPAGLLPHA